jgi:RNA polymerase sigma factor (TIGR02999 family)
MSEVSEGSADVTQLLAELRSGSRSAAGRLFPLVYEELRRLARGQLRREHGNHTLQPTALVHEAYLKLAGSGPERWRDRAHFFGIAARAMRQVLVDHARRRMAEKRGGQWERTTLAEGQYGIAATLEDIVALDAALDRLDAVDPRLRQVVEHRHFAGLADREIAEVMGVTERTVQRDWVRARAWLYKELYPAP